VRAPLAPVVARLGAQLRVDAQRVEHGAVGDDVAVAVAREGAALDQGIGEPDAEPPGLRSAPRSGLCAARCWGQTPCSVAAMTDETLVGEFTHQAESFNRSQAANAPETLAALVDLAAPRPGERWLEAACGPGLVTRALAPRAGSVHGVDLTPAMVELARRKATGLDTVSFSVGDATALDDPDGAYDGAVARFTLHHVPVPARLVEELARVVRPGGVVVLADHLLDEDAEAAAWSAELERLRDPSHWASLPLERLRALGADAGLELEREEVAPLALDLAEWLERGSGTATRRPLLERLLASPPSSARRFVVRGGTLTMTWWAGRFRRPGGPSRD
jgi:SAM-dependent methyltransferase